jgi:hypothetical protein
LAIRFPLVQQSFFFRLAQATFTPTFARPQAIGKRPKRRSATCVAVRIRKKPGFYVKPQKRRFSAE